MRLLEIIALTVTVWKHRLTSAGAPSAAQKVPKSRMWCTRDLNDLKMCKLTVQIPTHLLLEFCDMYSHYTL